MNEIKKTTLHPDNQPNTDLYPKTSTDQIEGLNNIITGINNEIEKKVNTVDNFVRIFTIPNGVSIGTLTSDVKEKLCNPDGHNYYVFDDTSQMILKYSFNADDEIIQYKAIYLQTDKAYEITMQILPSNGSWRRSQTVLNVPASTGGKLYLHNIRLNAQFIYNDNASGDFLFSFTSSRQTKYTLQDLTTIFNAFGSNIITTAIIRKQESGNLPHQGIANVLYSEGADVLEIRAFITDDNTVTGYYKLGSLSDIKSLQDTYTEV